MGEGRDRTAALYEGGRHGELVQRALERWPAPGEDLVGDEGDICRLASVAAWEARRVALEKDDEAEAVHQEATAELLRARATVAAVLTGDTACLAGLLLRSFFALVDMGHGDDARRVLEEWHRLVPADLAADGPRLYARMYHEKRGFSYLAEDDPVTAVVEYELALGRAQEGSRGRLKVEGALALARHLCDPGDAERATAHAATLDAVAARAGEAGFGDVEVPARANADVVRGGTGVGWVAFEVT
ncbi:MAG TPA: hypothetical protein VGO60_08380 [Iamia sp.]|jgi:hypothetical protein|nr:hypothetical protein [Iamia sp.]